VDVMREVRKRAQTEEIDYLFLMESLSSYKQPRDKLTKLLKAGLLIRVKKGLYVFGEEYKRRPYSLEVLANLIYGPSYLSFEYALSYHNLIPEQVVRITSACCKKTNSFSTPVGDFVYYHVASHNFPMGITWEMVDENTHFLIATKEKALADYLTRIKPFENHQDLLIYLDEGMRIDLEELYAFDLTLIREIATFYKNTNINFLCQILQK